MLTPLCAASMDEETMRKKIAFAEKAGYMLVRSWKDDERAVWFAVMARQEEEQ